MRDTGAMTFKQMCYEFYKYQWKQENGITAEDDKALLQEYYSDVTFDRDAYTFEDYLNDVGYNGSLYACFGEFCENEYLDDDYMQNLLNDTLYGVYKLFMEKEVVKTAV